MSDQLKLTLVIIILVFGAIIVTRIIMEFVNFINNAFSKLIQLLGKFFSRLKKREKQ